MKKYKLYFMALVVSSALIVSGCEDDNDPVGAGPGLGTIMLDGGGGYDNQSGTVVEANAVYDPTQMETTVSLRARVNNDTTRILLTFPGNAAGNFTWSDTTTYVQFFKDPSTIYFSDQGSTTITSYGNVGGNVEGSFSGTVSLFSADAITISGDFKARRISDFSKM